MNKHREFLNIITSENSGKIASSRCNSRYFINQNKIDLWNDMLKYSDIAKDDLDLSDRMWYYYTQTPLNICETCRVKYTKVSRDNKDLAPRIYCSKECQLSDPNLSNIIKKRKSKTDQVEAQKKRAATMMKRFGYTTNSQRPEIKLRMSERMSSNQINQETLELINDESWIRNQYITQEKTASVIADELGIDYSTIITRLNQFDIDIRPAGGESYEERSLVDFIDSLEVDYVRNDRKLIGRELDVFIPSVRLGIEYNGLFWHSIGKIDRGVSYYKYHQDKADLCENSDISLFMINSDWWLNSPDIVKGMIKSRLGLNEKIQARKCEVKVISNKDANNFHQLYHLQSKSAHFISYALLLEDEVIQVASFGKPRYDRTHQWELIRLSSKIGINVVGGPSRLISNFRKHNEGSIISYCDRQYSRGNVYKRIGFKEIRRTNPGYYWTDSKRLFNRSKFMKHKLNDILDNFDPNLSESENMMNNRYRKYYDCGQIVYSLQ